MNADVLLEHFHRLGDAPDAVPRLRRFILDLAVRGKLVDQDPKDEPASSLLKKITTEKASYQTGRKKEFSADPLAEEEVRFALPSSWAWARTNDVTVYVQRGKSPKYSLEKKVPVIAQKCVQWVGFQLEKAQFIEPSSLGAYGEERYVQDGDLLWNSTGHGSLGRLIVFKERFKGNYPIIVADSHVTVIRPSKHINPDYLFCWFAGPLVQDEINDKSTGTTNQTELPVGTVMAYDVPVPPLPEQHRIVAKVDELMALCDRLEAAQQEREQRRTRLTAASWQALTTASDPNAARFALEQLPALTTRPQQIAALRQTILDLAVRGRLVKQDEKEKVAAKYLGEPIDEAMPAQWRLLNFDKHFDIQGGNQPPKSQFIDHPKPGYVRLFQIRDLGDKPVPTYIPEKSTSRFSKVGEILIGRYGASVGKVFWAQDGAYNVAMAKFIFPSDALHAEYAFLLLKSRYFQDAVMNATRSAQAGFNKGDLAAINLPAPPLGEQRRIVAKVDELMRLCDALEAALVRGEAVKGRLLEAVLHTEVVPHTQPPAPVSLRVATGAPKPQRAYVEAEVELAMAAEPVAGSVKRGPGRPRKASATGESETAEAILGYLRMNAGWHGKAAILEATGVEASEWNAAIKELLEAGKVERQGEKKGARYRGR